MPETNQPDTSQPDTSQPDASQPDTSQPPARPLPRFLSVPQACYPNEYVWLVFFSALDIMLTWKILQVGGHEVNPLARLVIDAWGLNGAIGFKFSLMMFVVIVCEYIGARRPRTGGWLARFAVVFSALAPVYSLGLLTWHAWATWAAS